MVCRQKDCLRALELLKFRKERVGRLHKAVRVTGGHDNQGGRGKANPISRAFCLHWRGFKHRSSSWAYPGTCSGWLSLPRISPGQGTRSILGHFTLEITWPNRCDEDLPQTELDIGEFNIIRQQSLRGFCLGVLLWEQTSESSTSTSSAWITSTHAMSGPNSCQEGGL